MRYPLSIEGFERQKIEVEVSGIFATYELLQNGQPVHPKGRWKRTFTLTRDDGREVQGKWKWPALGLDVPSLEVDGNTVRVGRSLKWYEWVWCALPFVLAVSGGVLGGVLGGLWGSWNFVVFRSGTGGASKMATTIGAFLAFGLVFLGVGMQLLGTAHEQLLLGDMGEFLPWKEFVSEEGKFKVLMPGNPVRENQTLDSEAGPITMNLFSLERRGVAYAVAFADYEASLARQVPAASLLEAVRDGALKGTGGRLTAESAISIGSHYGKEITIELPDNKGTSFARLYLVENRLYQVISVTKGQTTYRKLFDSFEILD